MNNFNQQKIIQCKTRFYHSKFGIQYFTNEIQKYDPIYSWSDELAVYVKLFPKKAI